MNSNAMNSANYHDPHLKNPFNSSFIEYKMELMEIIALNLFMNYIGW